MYGYWWKNRLYLDAWYLLECAKWDCWSVVDFCVLLSAILVIEWCLNISAIPTKLSVFQLFRTCGRQCVYPIHVLDLWEMGVKTKVCCVYVFVVCKWSGHERWLLDKMSDGYSLTQHPLFSPIPSSHSLRPQLWNSHQPVWVLTTCTAVTLQPAHSWIREGGLYKEQCWLSSGSTITSFIRQTREWNNRHTQASFFMYKHNIIVGL